MGTVRWFFDSDLFCSILYHLLHESLYRSTCLFLPHEDIWGDIYQVDICSFELQFETKKIEQHCKQAK